MHCEDIHPSLKGIYKDLDLYCKEKGYFFDLTADEPSLQAVLVKKKNAHDIYQHLSDLARRRKVHIIKDENRKDGVLLIFTVDVIQDGYWSKVSKNKKGKEMSIFANDEDAQKVRDKKTIYQGMVSNVLNSLYEIRPSRYTSNNNVNFLALHEMELAHNGLEPDVNIGVVGGVRTHGAGESQDVQSYDQRLDATDLPALPPYMPQSGFIQSLDKGLSTSKTVPNEFSKPAQTLPQNVNEVNLDPKFVTEKKYRSVDKISIEDILKKRDK